MAEENTPEMTADARDALVAELEGTSRRKRQEAAHKLAIMARQDSALLVSIADSLIDALTLPEAQTRWECLDALSEVAELDPEAVLDAFSGAEESLFDDGSASARLAAFRFLTRYGAIAPECSDEAWPLISEAVQCYHGDPEYREMLVCLKGFVQGDIDDNVKNALVERMTFDAENGRGFIRAYSSEICSIATKGEAR